MDNGTPVPQTLWTVHLEGRVMTCVNVAGAELRMLVDGNLYLSERYPHFDSLLGRAQMLHRNLLRRGWADAEQPESGI
jgi:hypothetical protein